MKPICIIGEGAWGTAIASLLAGYGYTIKLWCHDQASVQTINATRCNMRYLSLIELHERIVPTTSLQQAMKDTEWIFEAIPVKFLRSVIEQAQQYYHQSQNWVILSKGIEQDSLLLPSQLIQSIIPSASIAVLSGPSFARDVVLNQPTGVTIAATSSLLAQSLKKMMDGPTFRTAISDDLIGIQLCAAFKNIIALMVGIMQGAGYTDNVRALIITYGLKEMIQLLEACGGNEQTAYGLAGIGDLVLTACSDQSRNVMVGKLLGMGQSLPEILADTGAIPEGINTLESVYQLMQKNHLQLPLTQMVYDYIHQRISVEEIVEQFLFIPRFST